MEINNEDKIAMKSFIGILLIFVFSTIISYSFVKQTAKLDGTMVYKELVKLDVKYPDIVLAQAKLETGNFTSTYCIERNNLFGFRTNKDYMNFNTWKHSCKTYKQWQDRYYKGNDYYKFLINIKYAKDTMYIKKLKNIIKDGI